uniref:Uncharacterized protein n=1 Tax=Arundo donax TaxID=35708 RepID=A0A0A9HH71_ARUDO
MGYFKSSWTWCKCCS